MYPNNDERETGERRQAGRRFEISDLVPPIAAAPPTSGDDDRETRVSQRPAAPQYAPPASGHGGSATEERETRVHRTAPEEQLDSVAWFYCTKGLRKGQLHQFTKRRTEFGRAADCDFPIEDDYASAHHGAVLYDGDTWKVFDFASSNGTFVKGQKLGAEAQNPTSLADGDRVVVGESEFVFKVIAPIKGS